MAAGRPRMLCGCGHQGGRLGNRMQQLTRPESARHHAARRRPPAKWRLASLLTALPVLLLAGIGVAAPADRATELLAEHAAMLPSLRSSPFGEPLLLRTGSGAASHSGVVLAVLPQPLANVAAAFRSAEALCGLLVLQLNVRACQPEPDNAGEQARIAVGPARASLPGLVYQLPLTLLPQVDVDQHFSARFSAPAGPMGSSALQLQLEAVALGPGQTYLHIGYSQSSGMAARAATRLYLATAGRHKIGFSGNGADASGRKLPVDGERAALERNVMRHYLALLVHSSVQGGTPAVLLGKRLRAWHALTERHAAQLHELDLADYLAEKLGRQGVAR